MATATFPVENYEIILGHGNNATWGGKTIKARGVVACYGPNNLRFLAYFLTDDSPVPPPMYVEANKVGAIFLPFKEMPPFVDLVRNEKPLYAYVSTDHPEWNSIRTTKEPVGEGEGV